jgi:hypothetical protein
VKNIGTWLHRSESQLNFRTTSVVEIAVEKFSNFNFITEQFVTSKLTQIVMRAKFEFYQIENFDNLDRVVLQRCKVFNYLLTSVVEKENFISSVAMSHLI